MHRLSGDLHQQTMLPNGTRLTVPAKKVALSHSFTSSHPNSTKLTLGPKLDSLRTSTVDIHG